MGWQQAGQFDPEESADPEALQCLPPCALPLTGVPRGVFGEVWGSVQLLLINAASGKAMPGKGRSSTHASQGSRLQMSQILKLWAVVLTGILV